MGKQYKYVSVDRIFSKLSRDLKSRSIPEGDVIEWIGEALEFTEAAQAVEGSVAFVEVKNHQCLIPAGTHSINQIARNNKWTPTVKEECCPSKIKDCITTGPCYKGNVPDYIILDCNGMPINDYDIAYYRPFFDLRSEHFGWSGSGHYRDNYTPVRLSTNNFFGAENMDTHNGDEYKIIHGEILRFSFKEGFVAISRSTQLVDLDNGYPMVPDNISYTTAIVAYIKLKLAENDFDNGRQGSVTAVDRAEDQWQWYCGQAKSVDMMPYGEDQHQNLLEQRSRMIPDHNSYYGFFGRMSKAEERNWNDPDRRNHKPKYFIGN